MLSGKSPPRRPRRHHDGPAADGFSVAPELPVAGTGLMPAPFPPALPGGGDPLGIAEMVNACFAKAWATHLPPTVPHGGVPPRERDQMQTSREPLSLEQLRNEISKLSGEQLRELVFSEHACAVKIQTAAYGCPPHLHPDTDRDHPDFKSNRQACNAEMMKRCKALCTSSTRRQLDDNGKEGIMY